MAVTQEPALRVLLVEPGYRNKYPPLGLMKLATFHKGRGDAVAFTKGLSPKLRAERWDRVYISTLFTFYWKRVAETAEYYARSVADPSHIFLGGVVASLAADDLAAETGATVVSGLLDAKGKLGLPGDKDVDCLTPDYSIIDPALNPYLNYDYPTRDAYIGYSTRGCVRKCSFCAVRHIEPNFRNGISIAAQIAAIRAAHGEKKDLLLLDNNVLASDKFASIVDEINSSGFEAGAKLKREVKGRKIHYMRHVDFNQGVDARLLTREKMRLLATTAISPLRIAFDHIKYRALYESKVRLAAEHGIRVLSNYILFNYEDTPEDFYERLRINVELNAEFKKAGLNTHIWSFPMKYCPISGEHSRDRKYVGKHWNKKYLRGVQCILLATHGVVGPKLDFFEAAFGRNVDKFKEIIMLPEDFIIHREKHKNRGDVARLADLFELLPVPNQRALRSAIADGGYENAAVVHDAPAKRIAHLYNLRRRPHPGQERLF